MQRLSAALLPFLFCAAASASTTWIVDDSGGAGVDFTDLPAAVASVAAGDVLIVKPGNYTGFTLDKELTIIGEAGVTVTSPSTITNLVAGSRATLARLTLRRLKVIACAGPVVFEDVDVSTGSFGPSSPALEVLSSADVRFHDCSVAGTLYEFGHGARVNASRVEFASCTVSGGDAFDAPNSDDGYHGGYGIRCEDSSRVHFALTSVFGGDGGNACSGLCGGGYGGNGRPAIEVSLGSTAIVAGIGANAIVGGRRGSGNFPGANAPGIEVSSGADLRWSAVTIEGGGTGSSQAAPIVVHSSTATQVSPPDPTLQITGDSVPGGAMVLTLYAAPGTNGRLQQGNQMLVVDDGQTIERLNNRLRLHPLGPVPASGVQTFNWTVTTSWPPGRFRVFQGLQFDPVTALLIDRTNSVPVVVH